MAARAVRGLEEAATPWEVGVVRVGLPLGQTHTLSPQSALHLKLVDSHLAEPTI